MIMTLYRCNGSIRGNCGHKHTTLSGAIRCLDRDARKCASQGGYSDRSIQAQDAPSDDWRSLTELEYDRVLDYM